MSILNDAFQRIKNEGPVIKVSILLMILFWVVDSLMDSLVMKEGDVFQQLFSPEHHEKAMRLMSMLMLLVFALYTMAIIRQRKKLEKDLQATLKSAEDEKAKNVAILAAIGDGISIQDTELRIFYQNQIHKDLMGDHYGEFCYKAYQQKDAPCEGCHLLLSLHDGMIHRREVSTIWQNGPRHVEIIASPLRDYAGNIIAGIEMVRDITKRKQTENEIRKLNMDLSQQAAELAAANKELEAFSYSVSHDLRTPLTRIYSSSQALMDGYSPCFDENGTFFVRTINDACEQMEELIESLLTLSRVANNEINREEVNLSMLAKEIANVMQQVEPERRVVFDINPQVTAHGDSPLLKVVLENLLGNAWKFTRMRDDARIEFGVAEVAGERVYFVRDNGAGFDMKNAANLFKPFQRLHNPAKFPGTGVGLATVQRIIQRHGGRVWGEGTVDQGAVFYFTLN
jgi:PAS domain S-box-containing protein